MTSAEMFAALRTRYGKEAVLVAEVADSTGATRSRRIDAIAVGLWPSRGLYVHAIEIKVSRSDLARELAAPEKADSIGRFCDAFWLATPAGLVPDLSALPSGWGLYEVADDGTTRARKDAARIERELPSLGFIASLARALVEQHSDDAQIERIRREAEDEGYRRAHAMFEEQIREADERTRVAQAAVSSLRSALGTMDAWGIGKLRQMVVNLSGQCGSLNAVRANARGVVDHADRIEALVKALLPSAEETNSVTQASPLPDRHDPSNRAAVAALKGTP